MRSTLKAQVTLLAGRRRIYCDIGSGHFTEMVWMDAPRSTLCPEVTWRNAACVLFSPGHGDSRISRGAML